MSRIAIKDLSKLEAPRQPAGAIGSQLLAANYVLPVQKINISLGYHPIDFEPVMVIDGGECGRIILMEEEICKTLDAVETIMDAINVAVIGLANYILGTSDTFATEDSIIINNDVSLHLEFVDNTKLIVKIVERVNGVDTCLHLPMSDYNMLYKLVPFLKLMHRFNLNNKTEVQLYYNDYVNHCKGLNQLSLGREMYFCAQNNSTTHDFLRLFYEIPVYAASRLACDLILLK